jgi:transposase
MSYIVAARLGNASNDLAELVCKRLVKQDGRTVRVAGPNGDLVCSYSAKRYRKDKVMHEKDLAKAERLIAKGEPGKRAKFIKGGSKVYEMDIDRINRAKSLLGIKGYYTNIPREQLSNKEVITRYHDLWQVEKAFRMAKSDLGARPVFHRMETAVRTHLLICFVALMMAKAMELRTKRSLRNCIDALWKVTDATLYHPETQKRTTIRSNIPLETRQILRKLKVPY